MESTLSECFAGFIGISTKEAKNIAYLDLTYEMRTLAEYAWFIFLANFLIHKSRFDILFILEHTYKYQS
jgi:hypothetical protein